ncbi:Zn-dependent hydrolase [Sinirhodobacter populi]|uniref:Zn-dependent hydrolase n=2 Tax=Paenirhodobacter populi TaxID=2306993 RepID=A0A443J4Z1_9RHOB|nr:Zn-dependent hydrolase [Sinirhodobacter populi]
MIPAQDDTMAQTVRMAVFGQRDFAAGFFDDLAAIGTDPAGGITRDTYGPGENRGHEVMARAAEASGLGLSVDAAGNTYARWTAADDLRTVMMGSHLDSVPRGGNFDGAAGALAGLVAIRALRALDARPRINLCAMGIRAEESVWFQTSYVGSRAALGTLPVETYDTARRIDTGRTLADHMAACGCDVEALRNGARPLDPATLEAYIELHIEQAPSLVEEGRSIGICTGIPGNFRYPDAKIVGRHGHVGTPHRFRHDAAIAGAEIATEMEKLWTAREAEGTPLAVTFGRFHTDAAFHGLTTVPGLFHFSIDVRAYDEKTLAEIEQEFLRIVARAEANHSVRVELGSRKSAPVGPVDPDLRGGLVAAARALGTGFIDLGSPASHDAAAFAAAGVPMAMLFIRNENGSHNPLEAMEIDDFLEGCAVLTEFLYRKYCR